MARSLRAVILIFLAVLVNAATDRPTGNFKPCASVSPECPVEATLYGYYPSLGINAFFLALFSACFLASLLVGIFTKTWTYTLALSIATFGEAAGYVGRVMMHSNPWSDTGLKLQVCCLILAPSFLAAAIYLTLKHFVLYCGPQHSIIKPRLYPWMFVGCDFGSIVLQAVGGGMAAAGGSTNKKLIDSGNHLIVAGIVFQVVTMAVCGVFVLVYVVRYRRASSKSADAFEKSHWQIDKARGEVHPAKVKLFAWAMIVAYIAVLIRCIYRVPEMVGGWGNKLMRNEVEFLFLDGMMLAIACVALTVFHPAFFFPPFKAFRQRK